jgi:Tat protein translocase TatB subunit
MLYSRRDFATAARSRRARRAVLASEGGIHMFGIGYQEMFVILVVAMVIFGPSRLPELAGQVGRWVRDFRRMSSDLTGEFEKTFAEVDEVKKSFQREIQSIQDEVEGVGKSARAELKKSGGKAQAGAKKGSAAALRSGSGASGSNGGPAKATGRTEKAAGTATELASNGAAKVPARRVGNFGKIGALADLPVATKADPLADVSFFDLDLEVLTTGNGSVTAANGATPSAADDALSRVRRRRASAAYGQQPTS